MPIVKVGMVSDGWVKDADMVGGFSVSQTPAPNVIVPLNESMVLDLSATYVKSNVYTFRRVDLTNATSDYNLQVGEEAIINFTNYTSVPLKIATNENMLYEIYILFEIMYNTSNYMYLMPNNTTYSSSFSHSSYYWNNYGQGGWQYYTYSDSTFRIFAHTQHCFIILDTKRRILRGFCSYESNPLQHIGYGIFTSKWHSNLNAWSSLGTLTLPTSMSGYILVRRLV